MRRAARLHVIRSDRTLDRTRDQLRTCEVSIDRIGGAKVLPSVLRIAVVVRDHSSTAR
jgi:hypothetical protein